MHATILVSTTLAFSNGVLHTLLRETKRQNPLNLWDTPGMESVPHAPKSESCTPFFRLISVFYACYYLRSRYYYLIAVCLFHPFVTVQVDEL